MDVATRRLVRERAKDCCEYCHLPQSATPFILFHIEHIVAKQHLDVVNDDPSSLALACDRCNAFKGPNLASIDPLTSQLVPLFHPRNDTWSEHFSMFQGHLVGQTPTGRATVRLLNMNSPRRVELRLCWHTES